MGTASGRRTVGRCCRSTRGTSATSTQWAERIDVSQLVPTIMKLQVEPEESTDERRPAFAEAPSGPGIERKLGVTTDRIQSHGLDLSKALSPGGTGLAWVAVKNGLAIERASKALESQIRASIVQATNLGITVKDSPQNTLVFVTRLDNGAPVGGARVSLIQRDNKTFWSGTTNADGIALAPNTPLRDPEDWYKFSFVATAEKEGDIAYTASDWNEGILPWSFGLPFDLSQASRCFAARSSAIAVCTGLAKKCISKPCSVTTRRRESACCRRASRVFIGVYDSRDRVVDERTVTVNGWSSAEWTQTLPADGALGSYWVRAMLERDRPAPTKARGRSPGRNAGSGHRPLRSPQQIGERIVSRRRLSPARLPCRRHAGPRPRARWRFGERHDCREVFVRRLDGRTAGEMAVDEESALRRALISPRGIPK